MNVKDNFEETNVVNLSGLKYDKEEFTNNWTKRKEVYESPLQMPTNFEELLTGNFGDMRLVFFSFYPDKINKETSYLLVSTHIFLESNGIKAALLKYLKK